MSDYSNLAKAPLIEALIDIQVNRVDSISVLAQSNSDIKDRFPEIQELHVFNVELEPQPNNASRFQASVAPQTLIGYRFLSDKSGKPNKIFQARNNGFSFSKLWGYEDWETFVYEAHELWNIFTEVAHPGEVIRIATKYTNRIELPWPFARFDDYFLTVPKLAPAIDTGMAAYLMRLELPQPPNGFAIVTQQAQPINVDDKFMPIIFDVDVFEFCQLEPGSDEIWNILDKLRITKNRIFFESITDKAKEMFQ